MISIFKFELVEIERKKKKESFKRNIVNQLHIFKLTLLKQAINNFGCSILYI